MYQREKGITLIEQVIVFSLVGIMLPVMAAFFFQSFMSPVQQSADLIAFGDLQLTSDWLSRDLSGGPMGNNLGLSGSSPSLTSVTIGSSPGYSGNNALTITYHTWPSASSTTPDTRSITYKLEDVDPTDDDIQLVRRESDGSIVTVAKHIVDSSHVVFSGSSQTSPGGVSTGITLNITSTVEGSTRTVTRQASFVYALPRSFEPSPAPTPSSQAWSVAVPYYLADKSGYWEVIETKGTGNISANWQLASPVAIQLYIYQGEALGRPSGDSAITPPKVVGTVVASNSATTNNLTVTTASAQPAGKYMVYYFNNSSSYINNSTATVTYVSP